MSVFKRQAGNERCSVWHVCEDIPDFCFLGIATSAWWDRELSLTQSVHFVREFLEGTKVTRISG
jgi:hypothetical protein